jgi:hypothetical protein
LRPGLTRFIGKMNLQAFHFFDDDGNDAIAARIDVL